MDGGFTWKNKVRDVVESEDSINRWYHAQLSELERKNDLSELRTEQFKRKRALLRVEYWTKLDKLRNNAAPTVIGVSTTS